jgi:hypothetical protein
MVDHTKASKLTSSAMLNANTSADYLYSSTQIPYGDVTAVGFWWKIILLLVFLKLLGGKYM